MPQYPIVFENPSNPDVLVEWQPVWFDDLGDPYPLEEEETPDDSDPVWSLYVRPNADPDDLCAVCIGDYISKNDIISVLRMLFNKTGDPEIDESPGF